MKRYQTFLILTTLIILSCQTNEDRAIRFYEENKSLLHSHFFDSTLITPFRGSFFVEKYDKRFFFNIRNDEIIFEKEDTICIETNKLLGYDVKFELEEAILKYLKLNVLSVDSESDEYLSIQIKPESFLIINKADVDIKKVHPFFMFNVPLNKITNIDDDCIYIEVE